MVVVDLYSSTCVQGPEVEVSSIKSSVCYFEYSLIAMLYYSGPCCECLTINQSCFGGLTVSGEAFISCGMMVDGLDGVTSLDEGGDWSTISRR